MRRVELYSGVVVLVLLAATCHSQPRYWIALNFDVTFRKEGVALVKALLHPFTLEGESLYGNATIEEELREAQNLTVDEIALMFANNPKTLRYRVVEELHRDDEAVVYCDVYGYGTFEELRGAYTITVLIYLNTSEFVEVSDSVVIVKVRDSYTSRDPRSWIDVLRVSFERGVLLEYSWLPSTANGPAVTAEDRLVWENLNERDAPDFYIFKLRLPNFKLATLPSRLKARIGGISVKDSVVQVRILTEEGEGYAYIRLIEEGGEQTRKVYLKEEHSIKVGIRAVTRPLRVELWSSSKLLDSAEVSASVERISIPSWPFNPIRLLGIALLVAATVIVVMALRFSAEPRVPVPSQSGVEERPPL